MSRNGNYEIRVGATTFGACVVGAQDVKRHEKAGTLSSEWKLYGSQLAHWCCYKTAGKWILGTWTDAKNDGALDTASGMPGRIGR